jgi:hypothetical protein
MIKVELPYGQDGQPAGSEIAWKPGCSYNENLSKYLLGSIRKVGVEPITHDPVYVTGYGMKGFRRKSFFEDKILIFPRTVSELNTNDRF